MPSLLERKFNLLSVHYYTRTEQSTHSVHRQSHLIQNPQTTVSIKEG
jgi:hypothetical protein